MPQGMGIPNAKYWRTVAWSTGAAWFVLTAQGRSDPEIYDTFLLAWDNDVVDALKTTNSDLYALLVMMPVERVLSGRPATVEIREIWESGSSEHGDISLVFVDVHGIERTGPFMDPDPDSSKGRLLYMRGPRVTRQ